MRPDRYLRAMGVPVIVRRGSLVPAAAGDIDAAAPSNQPPDAGEAVPSRAAQASDSRPPSPERAAPQIATPGPPVTPAADIDPHAEPAVMAPDRIDLAVPTDLADMATAVAVCERCALSQTRNRTVFGVGPASADVMVIGEAPGAEEDRLGEPFVGRAGKLLDAMLAAVRMPRETVYIANILKCRPPRNRDPSAAEVAHCIGYLHAQIEALNPAVLVAVGRIAAQNLLGSNESMARMRGRVFEYRGRPLLVTYHPAYLLRSPQQKSAAWADLKLVLRTLARARSGQPT